MRWGQGVFESIILLSLIYNDEYARKVVPFLKDSYFKDPSHRWVFKVINEYIHKYNRTPSLEALVINLKERDDVNEIEFRNAITFIEEEIKETSQEQELQWLVDTTEKFCQDKAIYNAIYSSLDILNGEDGKNPRPRSAIPTILSDALAISFDTNVGMDYLDDAEDQYQFLHAVHKKVPFDISILNKITKGGVQGKTLNVIMGGIGFGKTQHMCHYAATNLVAGKKVLYITLEMSENEIKKRIDANLLDVSLDDIFAMPHEVYIRKHEELKAKTPGKLILKEYNEGTVSAAHFRHLLHELKLKKKFIPDIIYVDYLNLCASSRVKLSANIGLYDYVKMIAHELRGLSKEFDVPVFSATQLNRQGFKSSDPGMEHSSESFGLPAACDLLLVIIQNEDLQKEGQVMCKQLKNRYSDYLKDNRFIIGVHREKMRLYDVENANNIAVDTPVFDGSGFAQRIDREKLKGFK